MMRNYLTILVAILMLSALGCGEGKKQLANSPETAMQRARERSQQNQERTPPQMPNRDQASDDESGEDSEGESSDSSGDEDASDDGDAKGDDDADKEAAPKQRPEPRRSNARRRKKPPEAGLGGGGMTAEEMRKEMERRTKGGGDSDEDEGEDDEDSSSDDSSEPQAPAITQQRPEPKKQRVSFFDRAQLAFTNQHDTEGFQYLYAHALTEDGALSEYPLGWYQGIRAPRLALRWGVGVVYQPGDFEGDPPTIGNTVASTSSSSSNRDGGGGDFNTGAPSGGGFGLTPRSNRRQGQRRPRGGADAPGSGGSDSDGEAPMEELLYYTGDFGQKFVERFEMRRRHGDAFYGSILREIDTDFELDIPDEEEAPASTRDNDDSKSNESSGGSGDFMTAGGNNPPPRAAPGNRNRNNSRDEDPEFEPGYEADATSLAPGLIMLGTGSQDDLLDRAREHGIDVLVVFTIKVRHSERSNGETSTKSTTQAKVYTVKKGEEIVKTRSLSDLAVASAREKGRDDPVEDELDAIFADGTDQSMKSADMPELKADIVAKRIDSLLGEKYDNPLPVLVEVKSYLDAGLISQAQYVAAAEVLIGAGNATDLIDGDIEEKEKALEDWLPGRYSVDTSSNSGGGFR